MIYSFNKKVSYNLYYPFIHVYLSNDKYEKFLKIENKSDIPARDVHFYLGIFTESNNNKEPNMKNAFVLDIENSFKKEFSYPQKIEYLPKHNPICIGLRHLEKLIDTKYNEFTENNTNVLLVLKIKALNFKKSYDYIRYFFKIEKDEKNEYCFRSEHKSPEYIININE